MNKNIRFLRRELDAFTGKIRINDKGNMRSAAYYDDDSFLETYCRFDDEIGGEGKPVEILGGGTSDKLDLCGTCELCDVHGVVHVVKFYGRKMRDRDRDRTLVLIRCCYDKELADREWEDGVDFDSFMEECEIMIDVVVSCHYGDGVVNNVVFEWYLDNKFVE